MLNQQCAARFILIFIVAIFYLLSCKTANDLASNYLLYDKGLSQIHVQVEYRWVGNGNAQLHFTCDSVASAIMLHDSITVRIAINQDSVASATIEKKRFAFDSTRQGNVALHGIDSTKSLHAFVVLDGLFLKQSISIFIHSQRINDCISVYPPNSYFTLFDTVFPRSRLLTRDTLPVLLAQTVPKGTLAWGNVEPIQQSVLQSNYLYSNLSDTLYKPQTFSPVIISEVYPKIRSIRAMYHSLSYIDTDLPRFKNDSTARLYIELFWFKLAQKDFTKARELMRIYYNRVQLTNEFFTSYKEGWKTDRGMALILLGLADEIHADFDGETWVYYAEGDAEDIVLTFAREHASPVFNDLRLERLGVHDAIWRRSVQNWKRGAVFAPVN